MVTSVRKVGKQGDVGQRLQWYRMHKSRDLMYSMMTIFNNTVLNTGNLLREWISGSFTTHTEKC